MPQCTLASNITCNLLNTACQATFETVQNASKEKECIQKKMKSKINHKLTCVPRLRRKRANGKMPSMMSMPLLSTKMKAHLCGVPFNRCNQSSKLSYSHGRTATPDNTRYSHIYTDDKT